MCGRIAWIGSDDAVGELEHGPLAPVTAMASVPATDRLHLVSDHSAVALGRATVSPRDLATSVTVE